MDLVIRGASEVPCIHVSCGPNRLYNQASNPPPIVSDSDLKIAASVVKRVEERLVSLNIEWLLEKFKELSQAAKKDFLQNSKLGAGS